MEVFELAARATVITIQGGMVILAAGLFVHYLYRRFRK